MKLSKSKPTEVYERLFVGRQSDCRISDGRTAVIHACQSPCHRNAVGYTGDLWPNHRYYVTFRHGDDLYLNMIDPPVDAEFSDELFATFLQFACESWSSGKTLLIHCNQGYSRSPSLALLLLAKHIRAISNESFDHARHDFQRLYPEYTPGGGLQAYLSKNWRRLDRA